MTDTRDISSAEQKVVEALEAFEKARDEASDARRRETNARNALDQARKEFDAAVEAVNKRLEKVR